MASDTDKAPYKAWLAELEQVMTRRQIATAMRQYVRAHPQVWEPDDDTDTVGRWMEGPSAAQLHVLANNVRRWIGGSVPGPNILKMALISVVEEAVPEVPDSVRRRWPGQWEEFAAALDAADSSNRSGQKRGGAAAKRKAQQDHAEKTANVVLAAGRPDDIDPATDLGLGSSLFDDALPPYVARTADAFVAARLADPASTPITVIVGPPKSGKTRSLFHLLSTMTPQPITWWHNPAPGALDTLIARLQAVKNDPARPDVVILDDAGYNGVTPDTGLTAPRIRKIADLTTSVVLIVHSADLASWKDHATGGRPASALETMTGIGASPTLVNLLDANTVDYSAELDDTELAAASQMLTDNDTGDFEGLDLTRLAEAMATVDKLHAAVQAAYEHGGMRAALVEAAIDATITVPAGASVEWIETLTKMHFHRLSKNARWKSTEFDTEFDTWITVGFSPGSPHAIVVRSSPMVTEDDRYRLLDALKPRLCSSDRDLTHLSRQMLTGQQCLGFADHLFGIGQDANAHLWLERAGQRGELGAFRLLRHITENMGAGATIRAHSATAWSIRASEQGDSTSAFLLGLDLRKLDPGATLGGRTCTEWFWLAAERGDSDAADMLGHIAHEQGREVEGKTALQWWLDAYNAGCGSAANNIGYSLGSGEIFGGKTNIDWYFAAAGLGLVRAKYNLGVNLLREGADAQIDGCTGSEWLRRAAIEGHTGAALQLGKYAAEMDTLKKIEGLTAYEWFLTAYDAGNAIGGWYIDAILSIMGPIVEVGGYQAEEWYLLGGKTGAAT